MGKGYKLPRAAMVNADVARIINSEEVQSVLRPKLEPPSKFGCKKNPLKNKQIMARLNPGYLAKSAKKKRAAEEGTEEYKMVQTKKKARIAEGKAHNKEFKKGDATFYKKMMAAFEAAAAKKEN